MRFGGSMIGIAIINYNTYQKTIECIESIRKTVHIPYRIYLIDNDSRNESTDVLERTYRLAEDVELICSNTNSGYARGNNQCIQRMREDGCSYGIISNNDIICSENTVELLVEDLVQHPDYILVGPKIVDPEGNFQQSVKLHVYTNWEYIKKATYISNFFKRERQLESDFIKQINELISVKWVSGAFFAFCVEKMQNIGDFDPATFLFFEEYILSVKSAEKKYQLGYDPRVKVYHYHGFTTGGYVNVVSKLAADQSERYFMQKYSNRSGLFQFILRMIRWMETLYTYGKRRDIASIKRYFKEISKKLV